MLDEFIRIQVVLRVPMPLKRGGGHLAGVDPRGMPGCELVQPALPTGFALEWAELSCPSQMEHVHSTGVTNQRKAQTLSPGYLRVASVEEN